jgi:hypothetical protein
VSLGFEGEKSVLKTQPGWLRSVRKSVMRTPRGILAAGTGQNLPGKIQGNQGRARNHLKTKDQI